MENLEPLAKDEGVKKPGASLTEYFKQLKKKHRGGYEEGDDRRIVPAHEFVAAENPAEVLIKAHQLNLDAPGSEPLRGHPFTTQEIRDFCGDLKVLGKGELAQLLKWRTKLLREQEKKEREAQKKANEDPSTLALRAKAKVQATQAAAKKAVDRGLAADVDDAIAKFLDGGEDAELKGAAAAAAEEASTEDEEEDDRLEQQLKDQIEKRRKEDRKEAKRMMDRQRKQEWRKKMSLATGRGTPDDASELFKVTDRSVQALQEDSALPDDCISEDLSDEPKEVQESSDSEADDEMDRLARMEVDLALDHELRKAELLHKHRNSTQRAARKKKETRRQRVMQAWAGELTAFNDALQGEAKAQALETADQDALEDGSGSDSEEDLKALRDFQAKLEKAEDSDAEGLDADALAALAEGPDGAEEEGGNHPVEDFQGSAPRKKDAKEKLQKGREQRSQGRQQALEDGAGETALVPVDEEEVTRGEHRAFRWFSQDIFSGLASKPRGAQELEEALARVGAGRCRVLWQLRTASAFAFVSGLEGRGRLSKGHLAARLRRPLEDFEMLLSVALALAWRCLAAEAAPVTFKVGFGEPVASVGPHLAGSFQGWDPATTSLADSDMNGIYEVTMDLAPGSYEFKFLNGNSWDQAEAVPSSCSEATSGMMNRIVVVEDADAPLEVHVCFQECLPCAALPACKMFNCPPGLVLRGGRLDVPGASSACCEAVEEGKGALVVRSSAFSDGNWAEFWMNGVLLYGTGTRGLTVLELEDDLVKHAETFDTYLSSSDLEGYLSSVAVGNLVLMGIVDEGSAQLSVAAKALIASCGAQKIEEVAFRSSYALIGRKGGSEALSEVVLPEFAGTSVAVAQVTLQTTTTTTLAPSPVSPVAFCDMKVAEPPMSGKLALDGNLELDAGCRFRVWESPEIASCLEGTWVVVTGSSNALLIFNTLLMLLAPAEADVQRSGRFGGAHLLDAVVEDGQIIHYRTVRSSEASCIQSTPTGGQNETECKRIYASALQEAPQPNGKRVRVTMFLSFFWARTGTAVDLIEGDQAWAGADVAMVVQVVAWYVVCNGIKFTGCPRSNLIDLEEGLVKSMFVAEMGAVLDRMTPFCAPGGRAGHRGCAVATNSWSDPGPTLMAMFQGYNSEVVEAMRPLRSATFRSVDIFALGGSMPGETLQGHGSQILHIWTWQALLGGFCSAASATPGSQIQFQGPVCWRRDASLDSCTAYTRTVLWQCMNSMLCSHRLLDKPSTTTTARSETTTTEGNEKVFLPVDGGENRACRGQAPGDNNASYYTVVSGITSLAACQNECIRSRAEACVGIEHSGSRCEVWTRRAGIGASIQLTGFTCLSYGTVTTTTTTSTRSLSSLFEPVDGGVDRACRGASIGDNAPENYVVVPGVLNLGDCQYECMQVATCVGVEYSLGRCEVWTRPEGIQASLVLSGFTCQRLKAARLRRLEQEKRKIKRKKDMERLEKLGIKPKSKQKEEEKGSLEVAPLEAPKSIVSSGFSKPSDPRELAETMALGSLLVESKKSRMELLDAAYNRWTFDPNEALPVWFTEEEEKYNKPELPISKEAMAQFRAKLREINARPIRKVAEARARKKRRLSKKLEKLRSTAMALFETTDMSETAKARQMRKAVNKLAKQDQRKVTTVAIKKGGGGHRLDKKAPKGAKVKVVDRRMKADLRGQKKAQKRNPGRFKLQQRKMQQKINKGKRRGKGDKGDKKGKRQRTGGAE
ncbi:Ftsj3 [Symbiodinium sp. CCMP2592]|nr:Ftsj3 [Symbiodinium sp. CCMP2592]